MTESRLSSIALRPATGADDRVLAALSELDSAPRLGRPAMLALVDQAPVAAISLDDGRVVADPFHRTQEVVDMLRVQRCASRARAAA
jgi:hypothetical protein